MVAMWVAVGIPEASVAEWDREVIEDEDKAVFGFSVAAGPQRSAAVSWLQGELPAVPHSSGSGSNDQALLFRSRAPGGGPFSDPSTLTTNEPRQAIVGTDATGRPLLAFRDSQGVRVVAPGSAEPAQTLTEASVDGLSFDVAPDGSAIAAWRVGRRVIASTREPGQQFEAPQLLAAKSDGLKLAAGAGAGGRAVVAWSGPCPLGQPKAREPTRIALAKDGAFATTRRVPRSKCETDGIHAGIDARGRVIVVISGALRRPRVRVSYLRQGARKPTRARPIVRRPAGHAEFAMNDSGRAIVVWHDGRRGLSYATARRRFRFGRARSLGGGRAGGLHDVAINERGRAVAVWQTLRPLGALRAALTRGRKDFCRPSKITPAPSKTALAAPQAAISGAALAYVGWSHPTPSGGFGLLLASEVFTTC